MALICFTGVTEGVRSMLWFSITDRLLAIEVKSHKRQTALPGMDAFAKAFHPDKLLLVGGGGVDVELFLRMDVTQWLP